jgi:hypothetical protein|tara:strand:+ start:58 stop:183 length:126 start_codon:yes stop_codon:yes gene_type:complete
MPVRISVIDQTAMSGNLVIQGKARVEEILLLELGDLIGKEL